MFEKDIAKIRGMNLYSDPRTMTQEALIYGIRQALGARHGRAIRLFEELDWRLRSAPQRLQNALAARKALDELEGAVCALRAALTEEMWAVPHDYHDSDEEGEIWGDILLRSDELHDQKLNDKFWEAVGRTPGLEEYCAEIREVLMQRAPGLYATDTQALMSVANDIEQVEQMFIAGEPASKAAGSVWDNDSKIPF